MKQKFGGLWEHRERYLLIVLVLALVLAWGTVFVTHWAEQRQAEELAAKQRNILEYTVNRVEPLVHLYAQHSDKSAPLNESARMDVALMRQHLGVLWATLPEMEVPWADYPPDLQAYLYWLCIYLLSAECPDYASFPPLVEAAWPLMEGIPGTESLDEALAEIAARLETERGQAILKILLPWEAAT